MNKELISKEFRNIQDSICFYITDMCSQQFKEDIWNYRKGKGGGITRIFSNGVIEKGGVNFSSLSGQMSEKISTKMVGTGSNFFATGVSLVMHPNNPYIPSVHMNIRYIERGDKVWFGGGIDLTPYYIDKYQVITYHKNLKVICDRHSCASYKEFKEACDDYFYIKHRKETRGVGGIFFDYMQGNLNEIFDFVKDLGNEFNNLYDPFLKLNSDKEFDEIKKDFQLYRRSRYAEFNLVYDRGTLFGLETNGRIESILMSMPPQCSWKYNWHPSENSEESEIYKYLKPIDWIKL